MEHGAAATLLREARRAAGLTQEQLARLVGTSQSAIAAYEAGARQPTLPVLERILRGAGHRLYVSSAADPSLFRLRDVARELQRRAGDQTRLRVVHEFLRHAREDGHPLVLLVAAEPAPTGDQRFDALLAAVAEDLCTATDVPPPAWVHSRERFLDGFWWVADLPSARARALVHAPASYRRRGVMLDRHDLEAA